MTRERSIKHRILLIAFILLISSFLGKFQAFGNEGGFEVHRDRLFVKLDDRRINGDVCTQVQSLLDSLAPEDRIKECVDPFSIAAKPIRGIREVRFQDPVDSSLIDRLDAIEVVDYAEPVPRYRFFYTPNDLQGNQWHLSQIDAENAWDIEQGVDSITVAIVDDAVRLSHQDLSGSIHTNPGEIPGNGIDDDGNGYVDDVNGWDAADNDNDPNPPGYATNSTFTHGTHVAGIAAASTDNSTGIASIGFDVELIPVKIADDANGNLVAGLQGIEYAIAADADVINMSWGGGGYSQTYQNLFDVAHNKGVVCVAAAGNSDTDIPMYPASYNHVISVGATDQNDQKASFSNYGSTIDVMAPGVDIYSSLAGDDSAYGDMSGTSMAAPLTSGLCGLMLSRAPFMPPDSVEACLERTCVDISSQNPNYVGDLGAGRIDADDALACISPVFAQISSDTTYVCPGDSIHFMDQSLGNVVAWEWTFQGGAPSASTQQNPWVTYPSSGAYAVKLVVTGAGGAQDSVVDSTYVRVGPYGVLSGSTTINSGNSAYLNVDLYGQPPWDFSYTDGVDTFSVTNVMADPYLLQVSPGTTTTYELLTVTSGACTDSGDGTATVTVDSNACNWTGDRFTKILGGSGDDRGYAALELDDQGIMLSGQTNSLGAGQKDIFLMRMDSLGVVQWAKTYGGAGDEKAHYRGVSAVQTDDGGYIATAMTNGFGVGGRDYYVIKVDPVGNIQWNVTIGGSFNEVPAQIIQTHDGGYLVGGSAGSYGPGSSDFYLVKLDGNGNLLWTYAWGQSTDTEHIRDIKQASDSSLYVLGSSRSGTIDRDAVVAKLTPNGNVLWSKRYSSGGYDSFARLLFFDGGILVAGAVEGFGAGGKDICLTHLDTSGNQIWTTAIGGSDLERYPHLTTMDSLILITYHSESYGVGNGSVLASFVDSSGTVTETWIYDGPGKQYVGRTTDALKGTQDGGALLSGWTDEGGDEDMFLLKLDGCGYPCETVENPVQSSSQLLSSSSFSYSGESGGTPVSVTSQSYNIGWDGQVTCSNYSCTLDAQFSFDIGCQGDTVLFQDQTAGAVQNWEWRFGDGDTVTGIEDPVHVYGSTDTFEVELIVVDSLGCVDSLTRPVPVPDTFSVHAPSGDTICYGDSMELGPLDLACGIAPYQYNWSPAAGLNDDSIPDPIASPDSTTAYVVEVIDSIGKVARDTVLVTIDSSCCASFAAFNGDSVLCAGDSVQFQNVSVVNGSGPTYQWEFGPAADPSSYSGIPPPTVEFDSGGFYQARLILNDSCGSDTALKNITVQPQPKARAGNDTTACLGDSVRLGDSPLAWHQYDWSPGTGLSDSTIADPKAKVDTPISYTVVVTNGQTGCSGMDTISIDTLSSPTPLELGNDSTLCQGDSVLLGASGYPVVDHQWKNGSTDSSIWADTTGSYWVKDSNKCGTNRDTVQLTFDPPPMPDLGPDSTLCPEDTVLLDATHPGASYQWQDGGSDSIFLVDEEGLYWVEVTDPPCPGVRDSIEFAPIVPPTPRLGPDTTICESEPLEFTIRSGPPDTVLWQDGTRSVSYEVDQEGIYSVYAVNRCGSGTDTLEVETEDCSCDHTVPNVFTPNGDGKNDRFRIRSENCEVKGLRIHNRWGQTLYRQEAADPMWDGRTMSGEAVSEGTYFYSVRIEEETITGTVTLLRSK